MLHLIKNICYKCLERSVPPSDDGCPSGPAKMGSPLVRVQYFYYISFMMRCINDESHVVSSNMVGSIESLDGINNVIIIW